MYGKLINNQLTIAPNKLVINNQNIWNASPEVYLSQGWLPIINTDEPIVDNDHFVEPYYEFENNQIVQKWEVKEIELSENDELIEAGKILLGIK